MFDNKPWGKLVRRAGKMSWNELRVRTRQEVAKRSDLVLSQIGARFVKDPGHWPLGSRGRFFFERADVQRILDFLRQRLPDVADAIIGQAEQICQHRFDLLGYRGVQYGAQIDWHLDAVHGKRAPLRPWFQIRYLDMNQVGDSKIIWELNRHQHLVTLAKAYRLTGRARFARELFDQWYDWRQENPYPIGINWASSLEVAFRSLSWLWVFHLLQGSSVVPTEFPCELQRALMLNGRHIERFLSTYFSPNTHLLGEGVGLFFIGTLCQEPGAAERWQRTGWQIIMREAQRQVRPDGMHFEHSTYYHAYALDFFLHARVLAGLNEITIPGEFDRTIEKMLEVICRLGNSGPLLRLGDDDGGRVFDPRRNQVEHMLDPLALGTLLFNRGDFKTVAGDVREETVWLSGVDAARRFDDLDDARPAAVSFALESSGIHVMSSSERSGQRLVVNAGPSEQGRNGHRHVDALCVDLAIHGQPVLIDPGTFSYVDDGGERNRFRGTAAHNTATIDGLNQARPGGPFGWQGLRSAQVDRWAIGRSFDLFEGSHKGHGRFNEPVEHRRSILYWKPHFWLVRDTVEGVGRHEVGIHWHFAGGSLTTIPGGAMFFHAPETTLGLLFASGQAWSRDISRDWHSPVYGSKEPAPVLRCTIAAALPVELVSLLIPLSTTADNPGILETVAESEGASVCAYRYTTAATEYLFVFAKAPGNWRLGSWSSDARFFFCAGVGGERPDRFVMCEGSYLALNARRVLVAREPLKYAESFCDGGGRRFHCSNAGVVDLDPVTVEARDASLPNMLTAV